MALGNFSVGRDVSIRIVTDAGILVVDRLTEFDAKPEYTELTSAGINGVFETEFQPKRWSGSFMADRRNANLDAYFAQFEADFFNGVRRKNATITEIISEANGAITKWQYQRVALKLAEAGSWAGEKLVVQRMDFACPRRVQLA